MRVEAFAGERRGEPVRAFRAVVPHRDRFDRPHAGVGAGEEGGELAGADDQQPLGVGAREIARRQSRGGGGAPDRQPRSVEGGDRRAGDARLQHVEALHRRQAARAVAGKDVDDLGAEEVVGRTRTVVQAGISSVVAVASPGRSIGW